MRGITSVVLGCVLLLGSLTVAGDADARDRFLGASWGGAWGVSADKGAPDPDFAFDANIEFRLFVTNDISIDFSFDIGETIRMHQDWAGGSSVVQAGAFKAYGHFWIPQGDGKFFCLAPFIGVRGVSWGGASVNIFEVGSRIGGEVYVTETMTMGFYGRPSFHVSGGSYSIWGVSSSVTTPGFEAVFEMTWTIHLPVPRPTT